MTDHDPRLVNLARTFLVNLFADGRPMHAADLAELFGPPGRSPFGLAITALLADGVLVSDGDVCRAGSATPSAQPSRTFQPTPEQAHGDPLLAAAFRMGLTEGEVIALQVAQMAEMRAERVRRLETMATPFSVVAGRQG